MRVVIVRGLPGSGKSTLARDLAGRAGCIHLEADMFFVRDGEYDWRQGGENHFWCQEMFRTAVQHGMDVVVSNTFTRVSEMRPYVEFAKRYGASIRVIAAKGRYGSIHAVPEETLSAMRARWEDYDGEEVVGEQSAGVCGEAAETPARSVTDPAAGTSAIVVESPSEEVREIVSSPLVKVRDLGDGIVSCNFTRRAFLGGKWDFATRHARGLFLRDGRVFARSFNKFFRINERPESSVTELMARIRTATGVSAYEESAREPNALAFG